MNKKVQFVLCAAEDEDLTVFLEPVPIPFSRLTLMLWCFLIEEFGYVLIKPTVSHSISLKNHLKLRFSKVLRSSKDLPTSFMNLSRTTGVALALYLPCNGVPNQIHNLPNQL
ncbi:unnamed protein product [Orchesella dallaii]|uniref:Uncharacterized protein n=1 Tax=Orchesella dallaii TaxID=48710 RepID=A0ABP1R6M9_9HEXA